jgi:hypothetical protein
MNPLLFSQKEQQGKHNLFFSDTCLHALKITKLNEFRWKFSCKAKTLELPEIHGKTKSKIEALLTCTYI